MKKSLVLICILFLFLGSCIEQKKLIDNISTEIDTVLINEPFKVDYTFDGVYISPVLKMFGGAEARKNQPKNPVDSIRIRGSHGLEKINLGSYFEMINTNKDETSTVKFCFSANRSGVLELPPLNYYRKGEKFIVAGKTIFVKEDKMSSADSSKIIKKIAPFDMSFPETEAKIKFNESKSEAKVLEEIIRAKAGETFKVTYGTNCSAGSKKIAFGDFDKKDLEIVSGPNKTTSMSIINGVTSQSETVTYEMKTDKTGTYILGPFSVTCDGEVLKTKEIKVIVE